MARVQVIFDGVSRGAVRAGRETESAIDRVGNAATRNTRKVVSFASSSQRSLANLAGSIGRGVGVGGGVAAGGLVGAIAFAGFRFDDLKQRSTIAFSTMLGSAAKAKSFLKDLTGFANRTPFELPGLIKASQQLLAFGFNAKQIVPVLTAAGNAVAGMGGDPQAMDATIRAIGQIQAKGRLMAEEMMQLNEAGTFSWRALASAIGVSVPKAMALVQKGAVTSDAFLAAFAENSNKRFAGMMDKQSHTFSGLLSTLKDKFSQVSGQAMQPFFDLAVEGMDKLVKATSRPEFTAGVQRLANWIAGRVVPAIRNMVSWIVDNRGRIADAFKGAADKAAAIARAVANVSDEIDTLVGKVGGWQKVATAAFGVVMAGKVATLMGSLGFAPGGRTAAPTGGGLHGALTKLAGRAWVIPVMLAVAQQGDSSALGILGKIGSGALTGAFVGGVPGAIVGAGASAFLAGVKKGKDEQAGNRRKFEALSYGDQQLLLQQLGRSGLDTFLGPGWKLKPARSAPGVLLPDGSFGPSPIAAQPVVKGSGSGATVARQALTDSFGSGAGVYIFGAIKPGVGFDCSGLVVDAYRKVGINLPHNAALQFRDPRAENTTGREEPGDAVYFNTSNPTGGQGNPGHVGIYLGNDKFVEYYSSGKPPRISSLSANRYRYAGARRWVAVKPGGGGGTAGNSFGNAADLLGPGTGSGSGSKPEKADKAEASRDASGLDAITRSIAKVTSAKIRAQLLARVKAIREALAGADTEKELSKVTDRVDKLKDRLSDVLTTQGAKERAAQQKMRDAARKRAQAFMDGLIKGVQERRDAYAAAFGKVADRALAVFDAKTQRLVDNARVNLFGTSFGSGDETPAEKALRELRAQRAADELAKQRADALANATPEEAAALRAQYALDDQEAALEQQAQAERKAADEALDTERKRIQDERQLTRDRMQAQLDEIVKGFTSQKITADEAQREILALLASYDASYADAGALLGGAFSEGFADALSDAATAALNLDAQNARVRNAGKGSMKVGGQWLTITGEYAKPTKFASGGKVPGVFIGRDSVPAMLSPGEFVLTREQTAAMEAAGGLGGLAGGGQPVVVLDVGGVTITGVSDGREAARQFMDSLADQDFRELWRRIEPESRRLRSMRSA